MKVREMQRHDLEHVRRLACQLGYEVGLDELMNFFRALADDPDDLLLVAVERDGAVGWLHAHRTLHGSIPGPMEAMRTPSSASRPTAARTFFTVEELVNVIQSGLTAKISAARAAASSGMTVR